MGFRLTDDEAWAMIDDAHESILTTLRRDGTPVSLPVWHVVADRAIFVKSPRRSKKVSRVRHDPRGSLVVSAGTAWAELRAVVAPVTISLVDDPTAATEVLTRIDAKYAGLGPEGVELPPTVRAVYEDMAVLRLDVAGRFLTWDNSALVG